MVAFAVFNHVILLPVLYRRPQTFIGFVALTADLFI